MIPGKHPFMILQFPLIKTKPKSDLVDKLKFFNEDGFIERIFGTFIINSSYENEVFRSKIIFDTGAVITLLPGIILNHLENVNTIPHTMWGIIENEECKIIVDLCKINIQLIDKFANISPPITILAGFSRNPKVPILLGMKGMLSKYKYEFNPSINIFSLEIK